MKVFFYLLFFFNPFFKSAFDIQDQGFYKGGSLKWMITAGPGCSGVKTSVRLRKRSNVSEVNFIWVYISMHPPTTHIFDPIMMISPERVCATSCTTCNTGNPSLTHLNPISGEGSSGPYIFPNTVIIYVQMYTCTDTSREERETFTVWPNAMEITIPTVYSWRDLIPVPGNVPWYYLIY